MLRSAAIITLFCFFAVALLGNGCGLLCLRICKAEAPVIADEPDEPACGSCCASKGSCGKEKQPRNCPPDNPMCGNMDCSQPMPPKNDCDKCFMPRLDFTLAENKSQAPVMALKEAPDPGGKIVDQLKFIPIDNPRLWGIHPVISTTVLRI